MANARFFEILRCNGVDQDAQGMVVPVGDARAAVLETSGMDLDVKPETSAIKLDKFDGKDYFPFLNDWRDLLNKRGVDPQFQAIFMPTHMSWSKPLFFRVHGKIITGFPGTRVRAVPAALAGATLRVAVVDRMVIKVAIRNVRARDQQGNMRYHAKQKCNPTEELARMNFVWTPQTNIEFELVSSADVVIDHDDPKTQEELRRAYRLKTIDAEFFPESDIAGSTNWEVFAKHRVPGAHITFFFVHRVLEGVNPETGRGGRSAFGLTDPRGLGIVFISHDRLATTFAHEAGHFLGGQLRNGEWDPLGHTYETDKNRHEWSRLLMKDGGSGWKITFKEAEWFRGFFHRHPVH